MIEAIVAAIVIQVLARFEIKWSEGIGEMEMNK